MRLRCVRCLQPEFSCFCKWLSPFDPQMDFVILIHPIEVKRRRIVTGRMSHLSLINSHLIMGQLFDDDVRVNSLINDRDRHCLLLYPGRQAANLSLMSPSGRREMVPNGKRLTLFVIDGTWATAKKTVNQSDNLKRLPRVCFTPDRPSNFRVRLQPRPECCSTIEAIHHTLELLGPAVGFDTKARTHDRLLNVFNKMVDLQIELKSSGKPSRYGNQFTRSYSSQL